MKEVKCECGHTNPEGTILCEACGKVMNAKDEEKLLIDMRYEGSARRSQTYNKTIIDKIWNFFSSVKVGVWLIVITLIASALGTIFPQEMYIPPIMDASEYYEEEYGWLGQLYYLLGFHNLYSSWWYLLLIACIGTSIIIASLDRVIPLYRSLKHQRVSRHEGFLKRQRLFSASPASALDESYEKIKSELVKRRYNVREEDGNILAERGRFSRWGPYVNHTGLIIFLIGGMLRFVPGMYVDEVVWIREGERKVIPETEGQYYLENHKFTLEVYDKETDNAAFGEALDKKGMMAKNFQSDVTLFKKVGDEVHGAEPKLEKVKDYAIRVNDPLKFESLALYQVDYKLNELNVMTFALTNKETSEELGQLSIDLYEPQDEYDLGNGNKVEIVTYFPDFEFDANSEPVTKSRIPNNPAFVFKMITPDKPEGEISFVAIQQTIEPFTDNVYKMAFKGIDTKNVTALTLRKDLTLWILALGGFIFMIGLIQGAYWNHRRIWLRKVNGEVLVAGHTNKNWQSVKKDLNGILEGTNIKVPIDQSDIEKK